MWNKIKTFLSQTDWEEELRGREKGIDNICWFILIVAALYFIPICIGLYEVKTSETQACQYEKEIQEDQLPRDAEPDQVSSLSHATEQRAAQMRRLRRI